MPLLSLLLLACFGPSVECPGNPFLPSLLGAGDAAELDALLVQHGALKPDELPCIVDAAEHGSRTRRRTGARLLTLASGDAAIREAAERRILTETDDVVVWAILMRSLLMSHAELKPDDPRLRRTLIDEALDYTDDDARQQSRIRQTGLEAGMLAKIDGVEARLLEQLHSDDPRMVSAALETMPAALCVREAARLRQMLVDYEAGTATPREHAVFASLIRALVLSGEPASWQAARAAMERDLTNPGRIDGMRPELLTARNRLVFHDDPKMDAFAAYLLTEAGPSRSFGFDIAATRVTLGSTEPTAELVRACVERIETGVPAGDRKARIGSGYGGSGQPDCETLMTFLETGERKVGGKHHGEEAAAIGRTWLEQHPAPAP